MWHNHRCHPTVRLAALLALTTLLLTSPCSARDETTAPRSGKTVTDRIEKSPNDSREYRSLLLANGLRVTLIHDAGADNAAASMDVAVGSGSDPKERPGLAHFLEHMLFLGTAKYPDPGHYAQFIRQHGGSNNAFTSFANTNYFFDIDAGQLLPALDIFSRFFIDPLFTEDLVQREKNAVHSEFTGKRNEDSQRFWSARKKGFNPMHPMTGFTTGNLQTLNDRNGSNIRDELIRFYETRYSSNIMSLAVIGRESLDTLEQWVTQLFSPIENRNARKQRFDIPLYQPQDLPSRMNIVPLKEQRFLSMSFPLPKREAHRVTRPGSYIGHILGHEGKDSLLSALKQTGRVNSLSAGGGLNLPGAANFGITIGLTETGVDHITEIVTEVFRTINLIRESGLPRWIFDESQQLDELAFRFQEQATPSATVQTLAARAQNWSPEQLLAGPYRRNKFDVEGIREVLDHLRPDNLQLTVVAPDLATNSTTQWYDTAYSSKPIDEKTLRLWTEAGLPDNVSLPSRNEFLPADLTLLEDSAGDPVKLVDDAHLELWHRTDSSFGVPRANLYLNIYTDAANESARAQVLSELFIAHVVEQLNELTYPANLAGLGYDLTHNSRGIGLRVSGYADGQAALIGKLAAAMADPSIDADYFEQRRKRMLDAIDNRAKEPPYRQLGNQIGKLIAVPYYSDETRRSALRDVSTLELQQFAKRLFRNTRLVALSHGNISKADSLARVELFRKALGGEPPDEAVSGTRVVVLPEGANYLQRLALNHDDSSVLIYAQAQQRDRASRARYALLRQILSQPFYDDLRTRQQLGYFVFTYSIDILQLPSVVLSLQSPSAGPATQYRAIEEFMQSFKDTLAALPVDDFERHRQALLSQVEQDHKRLTQRSRSYWRAIVNEDYLFDASALFADEVRTITQQQIVDLFSRLFIDRRNGRIVVYSEGRGAKDPQEAVFTDFTPINSIESFKTDKPLLLPLSRTDQSERRKNTK